MRTKLEVTKNTSSAYGVQLLFLLIRLCRVLSFLLIILLLPDNTLISYEQYCVIEASTLRNSTSKRL